MEEFLGGLFCLLVGLLISLVAIGISTSVTVSTATVWYWLPAIIGAIIALLLWAGDADVFDFNPFN